MKLLPWTKFQDFYLRLGFVKVLVASLSPSRRSISTDQLVRRVSTPLLDQAVSHRLFWKGVTERFPWASEILRTYRKRTAEPREVTVARALLLVDECPSQLFAITPKTAYKIVDWARDLRLIGKGNQITESGLLLKAMLPTSDAAAFLAGSPSAWNPFVLEPRERVFLLFHLFEIDRLTGELVFRLAGQQAGAVVDGAQACRLTTEAFLEVLEEIRPGLSSTLGQYRTAKELAATMAAEVGVKAAFRERWGGPRGRGRRNAEHQAIPRMEMFVDLGLLTKPTDASGAKEEQWKAKTTWRYTCTPACRAWPQRLATDSADVPWEWARFAQSVVASGYAGTSPTSKSPVTVSRELEYVWRAFEAVRRRFGNTPLYSVAVRTMIDAAVDGTVIEVIRVQELFHALKKQSALDDYMRFTAGRKIDSMFLDIRDGFLQVAQDAMAAIE